MKVFKIPDGNGNIIFKVQTPDGQWHETDEQGNFLPEVEAPAETESALQSPVRKDEPVPKEKNKASTQARHADGAQFVSLGIRISKDDEKEISDYIHWRCMFKEKCTRASFILKLCLDAIRRDREYREFRKKV